MSRTRRAFSLAVRPCQWSLLTMMRSAFLFLSSILASSILLKNADAMCQSCFRQLASSPSSISTPDFFQRKPSSSARLTLTRLQSKSQEKESKETESADIEREERSTDDTTTGETQQAPPSSSKDGVSRSMVLAIGFYKSFISPLLPPACRFLPTCSQYGVQAIEEFGPTKGGILTAWRILRCSPLGGKGYDPPRWPPVSYTYTSWKD